MFTLSLLLGLRRADGSDVTGLRHGSDERSFHLRLRFTLTSLYSEMNVEMEMLKPVTRTAYSVHIRLIRLYKIHALTCACACACMLCMCMFVQHAHVHVHVHVVHGHVVHGHVVHGHVTCTRYYHSAVSRRPCHHDRRSSPAWPSRQPSLPSDGQAEQDQPPVGF